MITFAIGREIAVLQRLGGHPDIVGIEPRSRVVDTLIREEEEALVLSIVELWNRYWTTNAKARTIREGVWSTLPLRIAEKVVSSPAAWFDPVIGGAMKVVSAALSNDAGDTALGVAELGIVRRGLYSKFLGCIAGRNIRGNYLVGICCRRAGAPSIKRSLRIPRAPPIAKLAMCVGSKGRSKRVLPV